MARTKDALSMPFLVLPLSRYGVVFHVASSARRTVSGSRLAGAAVSAAETLGSGLPQAPPRRARPTTTLAENDRVIWGTGSRCGPPILDRVSAAGKTPGGDLSKLDSNIPSSL